MNTFFEMDCGGETVTLEKTDDVLIFHGYDEDAEMAAVELGFEPSACWIVWNAINNDDLDQELRNQSYRGNALLVEALLFAGAIAKADGYLQRTPLHLAAVYDDADVVRILLRDGAIVHAKDRFGHTPLHLAASCDSADAVKILLKAGASVGAKTDLGHTALRFALGHECTSIVTIIEDWIREHGE